MKEDYRLLRERMAAFNAWEANQRKKITAEVRFMQFLALYDLGQSYSENILRKTKEDHLNGLLKTNTRLRNIKLNPIKTGGGFVSEIVKADE